MLLQKLKKFIFFGFLFSFDFIEAGRSFAEEYRLHKSRRNYYLESREICEQTKNVKAAVCSLVFRYLNKQQMYKNQDKLLHLLHFRFVGKWNNLSSCREELTDTGDTQIMMTCIGHHYPFHDRDGLIGDDYFKEVNISHGFKENDIIIYKYVRMPDLDNDHFVPWFSMFIQWDTLVPARKELFAHYGDLVQQYAYIVDENEAELKYFRVFLHWGKNLRWSSDWIQKYGVTALRLFHICSTIIQNTYLRSIIELDWNLIPEVPTPVISKVITKYDNIFYEETGEELIRTLYLIPGSSNHYYKVSPGIMYSSLVFYKWEDTEVVGEYTVEVHRPILLVYNIVEMYKENFIDEIDSNTDNSLKSPSQGNHSPRSSSSEEGM